MSLAVKKINEHLKEKGLSRLAFSKVVGCSKSYIYELMSGRKDAPSIRVAGLIKDATGGYVKIEDWSKEV